jgi:ABC-2 type transport system ATP-binding protein
MNNTDSSGYVLNAENLTKSFDGRKALDTISFSVRKGEVFGLLGPNGAGKTTLIRTILDIFRPDSGMVRLFGRNFSDDIKDSIGYLPEEGTLDKDIKVSDTIRFYAELMNVKDVDAKTDDWLAKMTLADYKEKKVQELSKGMHRRLQFIIAVIHQPAILILDEPFSGLDPINIKAIKDILLELRRGGMTLIMSTHQMDEVERMCDRILMINKGKSVLYGKIDEIKQQFGLSVVIHYEGTLPDIPEIQGINDYGNYAELIVGKDTDTQAILRNLVGRVVIRQFEVKQRSMNEIFIEVCGNEQ